MSFREEERKKTSSSSGLGLAAAAIGVGVGAALYYLFSQPERPSSGGSSSNWHAEDNHTFRSFSEDEVDGHKEHEYVQVDEEEEEIDVETVAERELGEQSSEVLYPNEESIQMEYEEEEEDDESDEDESDEDESDEDESDEDESDEDESDKNESEEEGTEESEEEELEDQVSENYYVYLNDNQYFDQPVEADRLQIDVEEGEMEDEEQDNGLFNSIFDELNAIVNYCTDHEGHEEHEDVNEISASYTTITEHTTTDTSIVNSSPNNSNDSRRHNLNSDPDSSDQSNNNDAENNEATGSISSLDDTNPYTFNSESLFNCGNHETGYSSLELDITEAQSDVEIGMEWDVTNSSTDVPSSSVRSRSPIMWILDRICQVTSPIPKKKRLTDEEQKAIRREKAFRERSWTMEQCSICFDPMQAGQQLMCLPCTHRFHQQCLLPWLQEKQTCPCCRKPAECEYLGLQQLQDLTD